MKKYLLLFLVTVNVQAYNPNSYDNQVAECRMEIASQSNTKPLVAKRFCQCVVNLSMEEGYKNFNYMPPSKQLEIGETCS